MKYLITIFSISSFLINNAQSLKVYHHKSARMQKINNEDKVFIKLKNGDVLSGKININSDTTLSKVQIDNIDIYKDNIEYIQYSPISKKLKGLGIGLEIINVSLIFSPGLIPIVSICLFLSKFFRKFRTLIDLFFFTNISPPCIFL